MKIKTCGREPGSDLVLEHPTVSRVHARVCLAEDGLVSLEDNDSSNGMFLNRGDDWIRAKRITLCIGDQVRFGEMNVPLEQLTAVFGRHSNARLERKHFPNRQISNGTRSFASRGEKEPLLSKPRRNPVTGKIEENDS